MGGETYVYDVDGERVAKTVGGVTAVYFQGLWEQTVGGASKLYYTVGGQVVAMRDTGTNAVTYLHGDHLGSVSLATNSSGAVVSKQDFDPWGKARGTSTIAQTSLNYTGQRLDGTGLLYYHARYYDPVLARFLSADSVVPGSASGGMDGVALKSLTVDFHEPGFVGQIAGENNQPFWFEMSDEQRQQAGNPWGPANPQALNRYSYVQNNPIRYTDPDGHCCPFLARALAEFIRNSWQSLIQSLDYASIIDPMSKAASQLDPSDKGEQLTKAGRALAKHDPKKRSGSPFPTAKGSPAEINKQAQEIVDDILTDPGSTFTSRHHALYGDIIDVRAPDGRGLRYTKDGEFMGFLDPPIP